MEPKYTLIVKVPAGVVIRDTPRPQSQGALERRKAAVGTALDAYDIHNIGGVDYARLVPQNPLKPEWLRVAEADHGVEYVDVAKTAETEFTDALSKLADAVNNLAEAIRGKK